MTSTTTCADYEAARQAHAVLIGKSGYIPSDRQYQRSAVIIFVAALPRIGSSPLVYDRRSIGRMPEVVSGLFNVVFRPVAEQVQELLAALSVNKSQLAQILRVTRPTIYEWLRGNRPNAANTKRLSTLLRILERASASSLTPLNARFVRQPMEFNMPSLLDLLGEEQIEEDRSVQVIKQVRDMGDTASRMRADREDRLRGLGFEEPDQEQRREQLARNVALKDWPK